MYICNKTFKDCTLIYPVRVISKLGLINKISSKVQAEYTMQPISNFNLELFCELLTCKMNKIFKSVIYKVFFIYSPHKTELFHFFFPAETDF